MDKNNQIIIAGILIIILAAGSACFFYMQSNAESKKIVSLKKEIAVITEERMASLRKIEKIKKQKKELTSNLQDYSAKIRDNEAEISNIKEERENISTQLQEKKDVLSNLQRRLAGIKIEESALKDGLNKAKADRKTALQAQESMQKEKAMLEDKIGSYLEASRGVELRKIVVKMADTVNGKVIDVNAEYNFTIIDLGSIDNVKNGDLLGIYRDATLIARAVIENVYEDMSSVIIFDEWRSAEIFYGDNVKLLEK